MAEFSYTDDIAPMRGDFFNTGPLSSRESQSIQKQYGPQITELQNNIVKLEGERFRMQAADLAYERSMFEFDQAKERAKREREEMSQLGNLSDSLMVVVDDPDKTPFEKSQELSRMKMRAGSSLKGSATSSLFTGAFDAVKSQAAESQKSRGMLHVVSQSGDTPHAKVIAGRDGVITPEETDYITWSEANRARLDARQKAALAGEEKGALEATRKSEMSYLDKIVTDVKGISKTKPVAPPEDAPEDLLASIRAGKVDVPKIYAPTDIDMLKSYARILYRDQPSALKAILNQGDGDIIKRTLLTKLRTRQKELSITASAAPRKSAGDPYLK